MTERQLELLTMLNPVGRDIKAVLKLCKFWLAKSDKKSLSDEDFCTVLDFIPATRKAIDKIIAEDEETTRKKFSQFIRKQVAS